MITSRLDPKQAADRGKQIHDLLEDFTSLMDEINDNLDQYEARPLDKDAVKQYHKGLKELIEADGRFDQRLNALKSASETDPITKKEAPDFRFVLQDAMDSLKSNADMAREYMETTHDQKRVRRRRNSFSLPRASARALLLEISHGSNFSELSRQSDDVHRAPSLRSGLKLHDFHPHPDF